MRTTDEPGISVLLVEDDDKLARLTARYLESHGLTVRVAGSGTEAVSLFAHESWDLVLLDVMLPGLDGHEVCRRIRLRSDVPIILLTALDEEADRVMGLEGGADDYLTKPFSSRELLARVRANVRRSRGALKPRELIRVGGLVVDPQAMSATLDGRPLDLTTYELRLLTELARNAGRVMGREHLVEQVRGSAEDAFDRSIDVHVSHLRTKLGDDPRRPRLLKTVRGAGYLYVDTGE